MAQSLRRWGTLDVATPELTASASGITTGCLTCYAGQVLRYSMPPIHEGDTHRTLKTSCAYVPTLSLCHVPDARKVTLIIMTAAMAVKCTQKKVVE